MKFRLFIFAYNQHTQCINLHILQVFIRMRARNHHRDSANKRNFLSELKCSKLEFCDLSSLNSQIIQRPRKTPRSSH